jgi:alcohol dehydrogenase class IV
MGHAGIRLHQVIPQFVHRSPASKVVFRPGACAQLGEELAELGVRRPFVLSGRRTAMSPAYREAVKSLHGLEVSSFTEIPEHSSVAALEAVMRRAREHRCDGFVAIGGGSASDTAKAAALWLAEGGELETHATRFTPPATLTVQALKEPKLPIAAVPCTASGAEVTPGAGIRTADGRKLLFSDLKLAARLIVIDPAANTAVPASIMLATGMNGLAHCIEGLYAKLRTPVTDALARHAIELFLQALPRVAREPHSIDYRASLLAAAHLSGLVLLNSRTCLHHAICHAVGAVTGAAHGDLNSVILPHAMSFNYQTAPVSLPVARVRELQAELGVPSRLRDIGVPRETLAAIAKKVMGERGLYFNPRPVGHAGEIETLLQEAW